MFFCPLCNTLLTTRDGIGYFKRLVCRSCFYSFNISTTIFDSMILQRKPVDDVFGGEESWKNVDSIEVCCPKCENQRAYYMQIQIRSADEPSTIFYKCCNENCKHQWREG